MWRWEHSLAKANQEAGGLGGILCSLTGPIFDHDHFHGSLEKYQSISRQVWLNNFCCFIQGQCSCIRGAMLLEELAGSMRHS